jgi:hypothetical protein
VVLSYNDAKRHVQHFHQSWLQYYLLLNTVRYIAQSTRDGDVSLITSRLCRVWTRDRFRWQVLATYPAPVMRTVAPLAPRWLVSDLWRIARLDVVPRAHAAVPVVIRGHVVIVRLCTELREWLVAKIRVGTVGRVVGNENSEMEGFIRGRGDVEWARKWSAWAVIAAL